VTKPILDPLVLRESVVWAAAQRLLAGQSPAEVAAYLERRVADGTVQS
jgi:hypothetical protein